MQSFASSRVLSPARICTSSDEALVLVFEKLAYIYCESPSPAVQSLLRLADLEESYEDS